ncbi:hypothetical protein NECAME_00105, partial [Necator americanus]
LKSCSYINDIKERTELKGILVTGDRPEGREKKSLTIINHLAVPLCGNNREEHTVHL